MHENLPDAVANIMRESSEWQQAINSKGEASLIVYLDMKSPHAYISVRPTLQIAKDYKVEIDFRPYTLSYIEMGVSKTTKDQKEDRLRLMLTEKRECFTPQHVSIVNCSSCRFAVLTDF